MMPVGAPTASFSASWPTGRGVERSRPSRQSSLSATATAHSIAADDESPAPTGTSESIIRSTPGTAAGRRRHRQLAERPGDAERVGATSRRELAALAEVVELGEGDLGRARRRRRCCRRAGCRRRAGRARRTVRRLIANGSTKPVVVVGVLADEVDAAGRRPDADRLVAESLAEGLAHVVTQVASCSLDRLPDVRGGGLGRDVADPGAHRGFGAGQELELVGGAARRGELQMQPDRRRGRGAPAPGARRRCTGWGCRRARRCRAAAAGRAVASSSRSASVVAAKSGTWRCGSRCTSIGQRAANGTNAVQCSPRSTTRSPACSNVEDAANRSGPLAVDRRRAVACVRGVMYG